MRTFVNFCISIWQLTCFILGVLRFDATGPPYFIFSSGGSLIWPLGANISDVRVLSQIRAYRNQSLTISGAQNPVSQYAKLVVYLSTNYSLAQFV